MVTKTYVSSQREVSVQQKIWVKFRELFLEHVRSKGLVRHGNPQCTDIAMLLNAYVRPIGDQDDDTTMLPGLLIAFGAMCVQYGVTPPIGEAAQAIQDKLAETL